jgi:ribose/xylose/arabinose/galactoside ABC-type transport system permease subunit
MSVTRGLSRYAIFIALAIECLVVGLATDTFFTQANLVNVLRQNAFIAILAAGMTFVILTGGIDLSVGSVVALSGVVSAGLMASGTAIVPSILAGLGVGLIAGMINGLATTALRIPSFVVTLAMMLVVRGAAFKYTDARTITGLPAEFGVLSGGAAAAGIMLSVFVLSWLVLARTAFGRHVHAVGGNLQAAWLAGVRVTRVQFAVFAVSGLTAGLAGILVASRLNAGYPRAGEYYELDAIAAVVVGGTSLFGGRGSIWGTLAGAFFIGILNNGLNLYRVSPYEQLVVKGAVLLAAASLDRWRSR